METEALEEAATGAVSTAGRGVRPKAETRMGAARWAVLSLHRAVPLTTKSASRVPHSWHRSGRTSGLKSSN